jgi:hypothetical protein
MGWGHIEAAPEHKNEILEIIHSLSEKVPGPDDVEPSAGQ